MGIKHLTILCRVYKVVQKGGRFLFSEQYLLYTNIALSVGISGIGDALQQKYQHRKSKCSSEVAWDYSRTGKMASSGFVIGPFIHYYYVYLDKWFPGRSWITLSKKVFVDLTICTPVCVALFLLTTGILEDQSWHHMKQEFKDTGKTMCITDIFVWTPASIFNFYFLPTRFRILFDSSISLAIDTYFSYLRFGENSPNRQQVVQTVEDKELSESKSVRKYRRDIM